MSPLSTVNAWCRSFQKIRLPSWGCLLPNQGRWWLFSLRYLFQPILRSSESCIAVWLSQESCHMQRQGYDFMGFAPSFFNTMSSFIRHAWGASLKPHTPLNNARTLVTSMHPFTISENCKDISASARWANAHLSEFLPSHLGNLFKRQSSENGSSYINKWYFPTMVGGHTNYHTLCPACCNWCRGCYLIGLTVLETSHTKFLPWHFSLHRRFAIWIPIVHQSRWLLRFWLGVTICHGYYN